MGFVLESAILWLFWGQYSTFAKKDILFWDTNYSNYSMLASCLAKLLCRLKKSFSRPVVGSFPSRLEKILICAHDVGQGGARTLSAILAYAHDAACRRKLYESIENWEGGVPYRHNDLGSAGPPPPNANANGWSPPPPPPLWRGGVRGFGSAWIPAAPVVWCGSGFGSALSPSGVVRFRFGSPWMFRNRRLLLPTRRKELSLVPASARFGFCHRSWPFRMAGTSAACAASAN